MALPGFLKVLTDRTIGWADFRGNLQYNSAGNVPGNNRVALIIMSLSDSRAASKSMVVPLSLPDEDA